MADQGRVEASKSIRDLYNLKLADVNKKLKVTKSRNADLQAVIEAAGKPIPLIYFKGAQQLTTQNRLITRTSGKQLKRAGNRQQGVTVQIANGKTITLPHAFIATMKNGHLGIFMRMGKGRLKIMEKAFVTIPTIFGGKTTMPRVKQMIQDKWPSIMRHELDYFMSKGR